MALFIIPISLIGLPWWLSGKESACNAGDLGLKSLGREDPLEKEMATHSSILAWEIPWTEEPGGLQSTESQKESVTNEPLNKNNNLLIFSS